MEHGPTPTHLVYQQRILSLTIQKSINMNQSIKQKREELKSLSAGFKMLVKEGAIGTINEGLANYYAEQGHTTLKSYRQWQSDGYQVKKGSKALLMWGEPINTKKEQHQNANEEKKETFFPVAFLFSNLQVEPIRA
jgi:N-terminal domain of anti-restriction factor ArdC